MHLTVGIFGDQEVAKGLGKKGTTNDIAMYNHASSDGVFTYVCPNSEKIQPLLQALNMTDVPVLVARGLTKETGEIIIAMNEMNFGKGFIVTGIREDLLPLIKGTSLERFEIVDESGLRAALMEVKVERKGNPLMIPVDNFFNVKGIGAVILGIIRSGKISLHDKVLVEPLDREVIVKGIQSQDNDIKEAAAGMRVGLNLKGIEADELKRGFIISREKMEKSHEITVKFTGNKFFRQELKSGMNVFLSVGLQVISCAVKATGSELSLEANQKVAYSKGQRCIIASQNEQMPRIMGSGTII